jgi:hypothetical protein
MTDFTDQEKLACLEREVKVPIPSVCARGSWLATREIALMGSDCCVLALEFSPGFEPLFSI